MERCWSDRPVSPGSRQTVGRRASLSLCKLRHTIQQNGGKLKDLTDYLPHVNASLNALATGLLLLGYWLIKKKRERAHKWIMLSCFGVSVLFLICYVVYHAYEGSKRFPTDVLPAVKFFYYLILASHVVLAAVVPFLALAVIYFGLTGSRARHTRLARWAFPIWLYVSLTGVVVYFMLYHMYV